MCVVAAPAMAAISLAATAASTVVGFMGSMQQGRAAQAQANYQAAVSRNNAQIAEWQAQDAIKRGQEEEDQHRRKVSQVIGAQRAGFGASGFDLGDATTIDILGDTAAMGEYDALTIRSNAAREAWGYRVQGSNYMAEAGLQTARGASARSAAAWQGVGDLLGGATKFGSQYSTAAKQFGWGGA
jgi:hypothetical protein